MASGLTPDAIVYRLATAADPQVSPDGSRVAYSVSRADGDADRSLSQVWVARADGSHARQVTQAGSRNREARWSPDGAWLAFVSDRPGDGGRPDSAGGRPESAGGRPEAAGGRPEAAGGRPESAGGSGLFVLPMDGPGEAREVTRLPRSIGALAWSPDGRSIAFTASVDPSRPDDPRGAAGAASPGRPAGVVPPVRATRRPDYKQDNRGYLDDVREQVYVVDVASGDRRLLTREALDHGFPRWSPDGSTIATRVSTDNGIHSHLVLVDAASGERRRVSPETGTVGVWAWSPSGDRLVFSGDEHEGPQPDFFLLDVASGQVKRLTTDLAPLPEAGMPTVQGPSQPVWLDDQQVLFHGVRAGSSGLWLLDTRTGDVRLERDTQALSAGFSTDASGRCVAQALSSLDRVGEVVLYDRASGERRVLTSLNDAVLAEAPLARWERLDVRRGDWTTEAWLLKPADFDPSKRYPVLLDVHGGPHGLYGYGFNGTQQALAGAGFVVVYSNPRGSGSYGRAFAEAVREDWGGEDYLDLMAVVDRVLEQPWADRDRTGIFGYSYGGYMTSWVIGQTNRFKAAVCGAPCFDLVSMYGTSDIAHTWGRFEWGGAPHERPEWYAAHSPSTFAHRARTPTLIVHGEADDRCPIGQGEQMFTALHQAGCEVEFVRYPGMAHPMLRVGPPSYRADFLTRVVAWFGSHLGGPV